MIRSARFSVLMVALAVSAVTPALADTYYVYSQAGLPQGAAYFQWCLDGEPNCLASEVVVCANPEGGTYQEHSAQWNANGEGNDGYVGWGVFLPGFFDLREYARVDANSDGTPEVVGDLKVFVRMDPPTGNQTIKIEIECHPDPGTYPAGVSYAAFITDHGWVANNQWQEIAIPFEDASFSAFDLSTIPFTPIVRPLDDACLSNVTSPFKATLETVDIGTLFATMSIDFPRWETPKAQGGATDVGVQGRQFTVDGKPFVVNAVAYAPVGIGQNWQSAWADRPDRYNVDFPKMADMGANAVRLYAPVLTNAMLDAAAEAGLYVIPQFGVDSINLECAGGKSLMESQFVKMVNQWKDHPAILAWIVGNEVNLNLTAGADLCADFYPTLQALALAAENAGSNHPVGTAVGGMTDVCTACSDDLDLPNVDYWGTQLYLGCGFGTAFASYDAKPNCDRPLLVTEYGVDAFHRPSAAPGSEDQAIQASCLDSGLDEAHLELAARTPGGVLTGTTLFEWADEWWKAECDPTTSWLAHDDCTSSNNGNFPDGKVHEEWFGIAGLVSGAGNENQRPTRIAYDDIGDMWLGPACNMVVDSFDAGTGNATISFDESKGNLDPVAGHDLHYGPLASVSTYGYAGSLDIGPSSPGAVTLPAGDLFWIIAGENSVSEDGCHGLDSAGAERPCSTGNCVTGWNCSCSRP